MWPNPSLCETAVIHHYRKVMENLIHTVRHAIRAYVPFSKGGNIYGENAMQFTS